MPRLLIFALVAFVLTQELAGRFLRQRRPCCRPCAVYEVKLTAEIAKGALLKMMRSEEGKKFGWFEGDVPEKMSGMAIAEMNMDGELGYEWSVFHLNTTKEIYTFTIRPAPEAKACAFTYEGTFQKKDGRWTASLPKLVSSALQGGK